jgi:hypothetical protein
LAKAGKEGRHLARAASLRRSGDVMSTDMILNGTQIVTLEEALAGQTLAPPIQPEFSVLLVGALKLDDDNNHVRLYPADGREDHFYRIRKTDIDTNHVEELSAEVRATRGIIADRVYRVRVRPNAEVDSVRSRTFEARRLSEEGDVAAAVGACLGTRCAPGFSCEADGPGKRVCTDGVERVPCNNCRP